MEKLWGRGETAVSCPEDSMEILVLPNPFPGLTETIDLFTYWLIEPGRAAVGRRQLGGVTFSVGPGFRCFGLTVRRLFSLACGLVFGGHHTYLMDC